MKKTIIKSLIISSIITAVGTLTNFLCAKLGDFLLIKATLSGGEYQGYVGFGILLEHIYPMKEGSGSGKITYLSFDIINFILYFVIIFIIVFATIFVINKIKESKKEEKKNKKEK